MDKEKFDFYKNKLNKEKERVNGVIEQLRNNGMTQYNAEVTSELSFYDNHPADMASETFNVELGRSLEANEISLLNKIEHALESIDNGTYGKCKQCGKDIDEGRLNFSPYAENCIECQDVISKIKTYNSNSKVEEDIISSLFGNTFNKTNKDNIGLDAKDIYEEVESFNKIDNIEEYYYDDNDYVEEVEKISNEQYKDQLP